MGRSFLGRGTKDKLYYTRTHRIHGITFAKIWLIHGKFAGNDTVYNLMDPMDRWNNKKTIHKKTGISTYIYHKKNNWTYIDLLKMLGTRKTYYGCVVQSKNSP